MPSPRASTGRSRSSCRPTAARRSSASSFEIDGETLKKGEEEGLHISDAETAERHAAALRDARPEVTSISSRQSKRRPAPPFTTSTAAAGSKPQARLQPQANDAHRSESVRRRRPCRGTGRADHLHAHRLAQHGQRCADRGARRDLDALRAALRGAQGPPLQRQEQGRAGGTRGDSADQLLARSRQFGERAVGRGAQALPTDLAARVGVPDGREGAGDDDGRAEGRSVRPARQRHADIVRRICRGLHRGLRRHD